MPLVLLVQSWFCHHRLHRVHRPRHQIHPSGIKLRLLPYSSIVLASVGSDLSRVTSIYPLPPLAPRFERVSSFNADRVPPR